MFRTDLEVAHTDKQNWALTAPLVWEGKWEYFIIRTGFVTDFASVPRPVRWLLDNAGRNSEAAVLHDVAWRESKRPDTRIDPWHADGIFRRALRQTGSTALARGVMWLAVRTAAMAEGRIGKLGPRLPIKILQLVAIAPFALATVVPSTVAAVFGLVLYWLASWVAAIVWYLVYERRHFEQPPSWPWPRNKKTLPTDPYKPRYLVVIPKPANRPETAGIPLPLASDQRHAKLEALLAERRFLREDEVDALRGPDADDSEATPEAA